MNLERIKGCFQRRGYGMQTKFTKNELDDFLNSLIVCLSINLGKWGSL